jgi:hypothetical protein
MALARLDGPDRCETPGRTGIRQCAMHDRAQQTRTGTHIGDLQERSALKVNDLREVSVHRRKASCSPLTNESTGHAA